MNRARLAVGAVFLVLAACSGSANDRGANQSGGWGNTSGSGAGTGASASGGRTGQAGAPGAGGAGGAATAGSPSAGSSSASGVSAGATGLPANVLPPKSPTASKVYVDGYRLMVARRASDGSFVPPSPYEVRGVSWSPTGIGEANDSGYSKLYLAHASTDIPLIAGLHANTVKTYDPFERSDSGRALLDQLYTSGVMVIMTVMATHDTTQADYTNSVNYFKDHPAILAWMVGNEFNYNNLYGAANLDAAIGLVNTAVAAIHQADPDHPVFVSHGEVPTADMYSRVSEADMWSINLYPNLDLNSRFTAWVQLSQKPLLVGEYGADAFNDKTMTEDQDMQAEATDALTTQIMQHYSALASDSAHPVVGGTIYELSDEWWKDTNGSASTHDNGGFANAIYSDGFANEEWWGLTTTQRQPRKAYMTLAALYAQP